MGFVHYDLGYCRRGRVVEVTISAQANVLLMDTTSFHNYQAGRSYRYTGGHARSSPVRLATPSAGNWHVVIDLGDQGGSIRHGARLLP